MAVGWLLWSKLHNFVAFAIGFWFQLINNLIFNFYKINFWLWNILQDVNYGVTFSRKFTDAQENNETAAGLMNLHNNEAGRRVSNAYA